MAVPIIEVDRREVKRWISAGTLGLTNENGNFHVIGDDGYYLVVLTAVFATRWDAIWVPSVIETSNSLVQAEDWSRIFDEEELSELCGKMICHCFEVWHVVDEFDKYYDGSYGLRGILHDIESYERACNVLETTEDESEFVSAVDYCNAFNRAYDVVHDFSSFYPVVTYKRKSDYALDLEELRLAGCVKNG